MNIINYDLQLNNLDDTLNLYYNLINSITSNENIKENLNETNYIYLLYGYCLLIEQCKRNEINTLYISCTALCTKSICTNKNKNIIDLYDDFQNTIKTKNTIDSDVKIKLIKILSNYVNFVLKEFDSQLNVNFIFIDEALVNTTNNNIVFNYNHILIVLFSIFIFIIQYYIN